MIHKHYPVPGSAVYPQGLIDSKVLYVLSFVPVASLAQSTPGICSHIYVSIHVDHEKNAVFIHRTLWYMKIKAAARVNCDIHMYNCYRHKRNHKPCGAARESPPHCILNAISMSRRY